MGLTYKIILDTRRIKKDSTYPVKIRVYDANTFREQSLNISLRVDDWDAEKQMVHSSHPFSVEFNATIMAQRAKVQRLILFASDELIHTADEVFEKLFDASKKQKYEQATFFTYADDLINNMKKSGKVGNSMVYEIAVNRLKAYVGKRNLKFNDIDYKFLSDYSTMLLSEGIKVNTVSVYFRTLRAIYNRAIKEGVADANKYPFKNYTIRNEKTMSRALTHQEIRSIAQLELVADTPIWHWRNYFMLSFCLIGINFTDLLTLTSKNIMDGRVVFRRSKTKKLYSIKLHEKALKILSCYSGEKLSDMGYLLPVLKMGVSPLQQKNDIKQAVKTCNDYLKRIASDCSIKKDITTYYARYTWANIAKQLGHSKDKIAEALGHEYGNSVTGIYLDNYDNDVIDAINAQVIDTVYKKNKKGGV
ncbi:MAG: site-specific integrase [Flavipsychrobacter sp.]|nr:site-specific integrase [Flavipsychrobacter sp.]